MLIYEYTPLGLLSGVSIYSKRAKALHSGQSCMISRYYST
jgi:hypothetical protein